ncbi:MAG: 2-C-methyl-D-erythritol 4-phosphate cytidylyltransferase [Actinomycetota bacterium]|nr:2-C-methyl-D-erythritol 4-phosphate cytidylyltransferase [Actinomycetota bacterium]
MGQGGPVPPKALLEVDGRPLVELSLAALRTVPAISEIVVVHPPGAAAAFRRAVGEEVALVPGGPSRSSSVRAGVRAAASAAEVIAIHDGARPLVPPAVVARVLEAVTGGAIAAAPGLPVADTLKRVGSDGAVVETVDRGELWGVHTPQVIRRDVLDATLGWAHGRDATDDLGLVEDARAAGVVSGRIVLVHGDARDMKITFPEDLALAAAIVRGSRPTTSGHSR